MSAKRRIEAAIFDMDGLLIDSEPLWDQAEVEVMESLGVDTRRRDELPDLLGLRIDLVVDLWYAQQPWHGVDRARSHRAHYPPGHRAGGSLTPAATGRTRGGGPV